MSLYEYKGDIFSITEDFNQALRGTDSDKKLLLLYLLNGSVRFFISAEITMSSFQIKF